MTAEEAFRRFLLDAGHPLAWLIVDMDAQGR
jgi:hypothetical protein